MIFILTSPKNTQLNSHFYSLILKNIEKVTLIFINQFYLHLFKTYIFFHKSIIIFLNDFLLVKLIILIDNFFYVKIDLKLINKKF